MTEPQIYSHFAAVYDRLMADAPYEEWLKWLDKKALANGLRGKRLLDLGCGTGTLTLMAARAGYPVTGVDLSEDMLAVAQAKAVAKGILPAFIQQDMRALELGQTYEVVMAFCDVLNYLTTADDVRRTFQAVYHHLKPGGLFLFDVHSIHKIDDIFQNASYCSGEEEVAYIWECFQGPHPHSVYHELSFFIQQPSGLYQRLDETHLERTFTLEIYRDWLIAAGFSNVSIHADFQEKAPNDQAERWFFTATKGC